MLDCESIVVGLFMESFSRTVCMFGDARMMKAELMLQCKEMGGHGKAGTCCWSYSERQALHEMMHAVVRARAFGLERTALLVAAALPKSRHGELHKAPLRSISRCHTLQAKTPERSWRARVCGVRKKSIGSSIGNDCPSIDSIGTRLTLVEDPGAARPAWSRG